MKLHAILPGVLFQRGAFRHRQDKVAELRAAGIEVVVCCAGPADVDLDGVVTYRHAPFADGKRLDVAAVTRTAGFVAHQVAQGRPTLVHCQAGRNRSALINALVVRQLTGCSGAEAAAHVMAVRSGSLANEAFLAYLRGLDRQQEPDGARHLLYIIGAPGSGKTTLVRELVLGRRRRVRADPFAHTVYEDGLVQLGRDRETFGGTDALSMSVQPHAEAFLRAGPPRLLAEGDRLANLKFLRAAQGAGYTVDVAWVRVPPQVAADRRAQRGGGQDDAWLRGRVTKVERLAAAAEAEGMTLITLDGTLAPTALAQQLRSHPVIRRPAADQ